jgi:ribosome-associated translation inhibitor RaiA
MTNRDDDHDRLTRLEQAFDDLVKMLERVLNKVDERMQSLTMLMLGTAATAIIAAITLCVTIILRT